VATVKSIVTKWGFQVDTKPLEKMKLAVHELKTGIMAIGAEATAAATALFGVAETTARAANAARLGALQAGMTTEAFQGLAFAAKKFGVDGEGFSHAMGKMSRTIFEAKMGSKEALKSFQLLGSSVYTAALKGAPTEVVFEKIADRLSSIHDPAARAGLAMQVFGRQGLTLLPLLSQGSAGLREMREEAEDMGLILSDKVIKDSKGFSDALHESEGRLLGIRNALGSELLEPMTAVFKEFSAWVKLNKVFITQNISAIFKTLSGILMYTLKAASAVVKRLSELLWVFGGLGGAIKIAAEGLALFAAGNILASIGTATQAVIALARAFTLVKAEAAYAAAAEFLAAYALPIAIGVAIVALIALVEDLVGFFQGKESVTGIVVNAFKEMIPKAIDFAKSKFGEFLDYLKDVGRRVAHALNPFASDDVGSTIDIKKSFQMATNPSAAVSQMGGGIPGIGQIPNSSGAANQQVQNAVTVNVNGGGMDPHALGDRTVDAVQKNHEKLMRETNRAFVPAVD
jgi:hypothetical protein